MKHYCLACGEKTEYTHIYQSLYMCSTLGCGRSARLKSNKRGRPLVLSPERVALARELLASGMKMKAAAKYFDIGMSTLYRILAPGRLPGQRGRCGRPPMAPERVAQIKALLAGGQTIKAVAQALGVSLSVVYKLVAADRRAPPNGPQPPQDAVSGPG